LGRTFSSIQKQRQKIVTALDLAPGMHVWEIGPGIGALTALLLTHNIQLTIFEIDHGFVSALRTIFPSKDSVFDRRGTMYVKRGVRMPGVPVSPIALSAICLTMLRFLLLLTFL